MAMPTACGANTLVIRADADPITGTGHVMRCLALGQAWRDAGGAVDFVTDCDNPWLLRRLAEEQFTVHRLESRYPAPEDWELIREITAVVRGGWLLLDGYHFDLDYQQRVKEAGLKLAVIDDLAALPRYCADVVLNQNVYASDLAYCCESRTHLLLGARYALLRREFTRSSRPERTAPAAARRVLVMMGGADAQGGTLTTLDALSKIEEPKLEVRAIVGAANPRTNEIRAAATRLGLPSEVVVAASEMVAHLAWAEVAIAAAGTTALELAFMGVPGLLLVTAPNQAPIAAKLEELGTARSLGWVGNVHADCIAAELLGLLRSPQTCQLMAERGRQ